MAIWSFVSEHSLSKPSWLGKVKHELRVTSSNPGVASSNPRVTSSNLRAAIFFFYIYIYIYNLHFFEEKIYSHQVFIYLNVPGIPVRRPLPNRQTDSWKQLDVWVLGVTCASLLTARHLLMNKKDKNSQYTNIKIMTIRRKT